MVGWDKDGVPSPAKMAEQDIEWVMKA